MALAVAPRRCIDGITRKRGIIGYCSCELHKGCLTPDLMKQHQCLDKKCRWFHKYHEATYWENKEFIRQRRIRKRKQSDEEHELIEKAKSTTVELTQHIDNFKVLSIVLDKNNTLVVNYVTLENVDLKEIAYIISEVCGIKVRLHSVQRTIEKKRELLGIPDEEDI